MFSVLIFRAMIRSKGHFGNFEWTWREDPIGMIFPCPGQFSSDSRRKWNEEDL